MIKFSIVVPVYNEAKNIKLLIPEIEKYIDLNINELIIVDDGSNDNTQDVLKSFKNIKVINNKKNYGQSYSIKNGIINSNNNLIVTMDGDRQNHPKDINKLVELYYLHKEVFLIGGIRKKRQDNFIKILSSRIANYVRMIILKDQCPDTGCSLKVFDKKIFLLFPFFNGIHRFLPALFSGFGFKTMFVQVSHHKREFGVSKYGTFDRLYKGIIDLIKVKKIIKEKKNDNKLH